MEYLYQYWDVTLLATIHGTNQIDGAKMSHFCFSYCFDGLEETRMSRNGCHCDTKSKKARAFDYQSCAQG